MIAFSIAWWPIYRYWLFYLITFVFWYWVLYWLWQWKYFSSYEWVQKLLTDKLDDFFIIAIIWVIVWWRLWHVFLYERHYYSQHLSEIILVNQWWMSFIWWVCWVTLGLVWLFHSMKLSKREFMLLGDIILCIAPLWIALWRFWNYLNQELWWKPLTEVWTTWANSFEQLWLVSIYDRVDAQPRINTNMIQSFLEWFVPLFIWRILLLSKYLRWIIRPWLISWTFLIVYAISRFFVEYFKELPESELIWLFSVSQRVMFLFFLGGIYLLFASNK